MDNCSNGIISNQNVSNTSLGIYLQWCENMTLSNNFSNNNRYHGISLFFSPQTTLNNNTCNNNKWGSIYLVSSHNATFTENICKNNENGIFLEGSYGRAWQMFGGSSHNCTLTYNLLQENKYYGLDLGMSENTTIHHNAFIDNYIGGTSQAFDYGANNTWFDESTLEGNYWSDYSGIGNYSIDGVINSTDPYPLTVVPLNLNINSIFPAARAGYTSIKETSIMLLIPLNTLLLCVFLLKRRKKKKIE